MRRAALCAARQLTVARAPQSDVGARARGKACFLGAGLGWPRAANIVVVPKRSASRMPRLVGEPKTLAGSAGAELELIEPRGISLWAAVVIQACGGSEAGRLSQAPSLDLLVPAAVRAGATHREVAERFGVGAASVSPW
jgi:hypothetical protein